MIDIDKLDLDPTEVARELDRRGAAKRNLAKYAEFISGMPAPRHLEALAKQLHRVANGKVDRLVIAMPPGHAKSTYASLHFPAWYMSHFPTKNVIHVTHTQEFAERWGRRIRNQIRSDAHKKVFPRVGVADDSAAAGRWETTQGGEYFATGVGGTVTGRRADCLVGGTVVETPEGPRRIDELDIGASPCYVLTYPDQSITRDAASFPADPVAPAFRRVLAVARRHTPALWRVRTVGGRVVEGTGDHRVYTARGWISIQALHRGDVLLCVVREHGRTGSGGDREEGAEGTNRALLQPAVRDPREQRGEGPSVSAGLQNLRYGAGPAQEGRAQLPVLFGGVPQGDLCPAGCGSADTVGAEAADLRDVRTRVRGSVASSFGTVLQPGLQEPRPFAADARTGEPRLPARQGVDQPLHARVLDGARRGDEPGPAPVRGLLDARQSGLSPHRHGPGAQCSGEPRNPVPEASQAATCRGAFKTETDTVSLVEPLRGPCDVYDIEVEETHCFFGNGVLVHNCVIIDDAIRGIEDAESERVRESLWDWYGADLTTRLKPGGAVVLIGTRWHLDDLIGRVLAAADRGEGEKWTRFILPAIALPDDPLGRQPGEALWPEWQDLQALERIRRQPAMTPRKWSSLYQQNPVVDSGGIFDRNWFKWWREPSPPKIIYKIQSWDTALTAKDTNAWTACTTWGVFEDEHKIPNLILLNATRWRVEYPELRKLARQLAEDYRWDKLGDEQLDKSMLSGARLKPDTILVEAKMSGISLIQDLARAGITATRFDPDKFGDKLSRVRLITDLVENGRIWLPAQPPAFSSLRKYAELFLEQCVQFPAADSRDMVDTFTQVLHRIKASGWVKNTDDPAPVDDYAIRRETAEPFY